MKPSRALRSVALVAPLALASTSCATRAVPARAPIAAECPPSTATGEAREIETVSRFYEAFDRKDFPAMACCYDPDVEFTDSIFGTLRGKRALAMWSMLVGQAEDLEIRYADVRAQGTRGGAHWTARYTVPFLVFDNQVENSVEATFEFKDGRIKRHRDVFDLDRWMRAALWPAGGVAQQSTVKASVQSALDDYIADHPEFQESASATP